MKHEPLLDLRARQLPPISRRVNRLILVVVGLSLAAMSVITMVDLTRRFEFERRNTILVTAQVFSSAASQAVARSDEYDVMQTLRALSSVPHVLRAEVVDRGGHVIGELDEDTQVSLAQLLAGGAIRVNVPVVDNAEHVGRLSIWVGTDELPKQLAATLFKNGVAALVVLGLSFVLAQRLQRSITTPLGNLVAAMGSTHVDNRFDAVREVTRDRETFLLSLAFNKMIAEVRQATEEILAREDEIIGRLARAAEYRDDQTGAHVARVATVSGIIASGLQLDPSYVRNLSRASPMHDIGKVAVPDAILFKPGPLDDEERKIMQMHAQAGYQILSGSKSALVRLAAEIAVSHHERWDGGGYPAGLSHDHIPLSGRITAVADVCDALLSDRPYKKAWTPNEVRAYLMQNSGKHFDPRCVEALTSKWDKLLSLYSAKDEVAAEISPVKPVVPRQHP
jgi:putative two-component system response regulator